MATHELLEPVRHAKLRVRASAAQPPHFVQVLAGEFAAAAACCPVLFSKDTNDGRFFAGAMFGFKPGENLVGVDQCGGFDPLMLRREGFFISGQQIAIDRDHPRFSESDGEPLFDDAGTPAAPLRALQRALGEIQAGVEQTQSFIAAMSELKLIEPIDVSLTFSDGERLSLQGLYTVSLDRLRAIDDAAVLRLFRTGHLQLAYVMAASLRHLGRLAQLRNRRT
jgi:SapC